MALARAAASEAGALLLTLQHDGLPDRGDRGDRAANDLILACLRAERPDDFILSEEAADDRTRCAARRVWIVDPLDGTREYGEGRDDWAVHVGLAVDGRPVAGVVALPPADELFDSLSATAKPGPERKPLIAVSRSRTPAIAERAAAAIGGELVQIGSAGVKTMAVLQGRVDAYLHTGGQHEWDNCAPVAIALAAGLHASRIDGTPLVYNCADTLIPDILVCRPDLAAPLLAALAAG